jgi:cytochrome c peroxidase
LSDIEKLGKRIFFDEQLSINANQSCAACHADNVGWTGPLSNINAHGAVYEGSIAGRFGNRKPPSSAYATLSPVFHYWEREGLFIGGNFWDGRATGEKLGNPAADQALGPFLNPLEQALYTPSDVVVRICSGSYADLFTSVWGFASCDPTNVDTAYNNVGLSVAAYEGSPEVNAFTSKYDAFLAKKVKLNRDERLGLSLFNGKAKCSLCHTVSGMAPVFTDFTFDNLGVPRNPENPFYTQTAFNPDGYNWVDKGLGGFLETRPDYADKAADNYGKQKVPTLRNVDKRPSDNFVKAYSHNGYFKSLKGIVHFYNTRDVKPTCANIFTTEADALAQNCWPVAEIEANVNKAELGNLKLTDAEENALVAFMKTLSDGFIQ